MQIFRLVQLGILAAFLAGCASHEGGLSGAHVPSPAEAPALETKAVPFRYAPKDGEYRYASVTVFSDGQSATRSGEVDFSVKISRRADRFVNDSTITALLVNGSTPPNVEDRIKAFHCQSVLDPHGTIVSWKAKGDAMFLPAGAKDLGTAFTLPSEPVKLGGTWSREVTDKGEPYTIIFTFTSLEKVGKQSVATFEERGTDKSGSKTDRPTVIKIDADTGVLLDKVADATLEDPKQPGKTIVFHSEIKLQ